MTAITWTVKPLDQLCDSASEHCWSSSCCCVSAPWWNWVNGSNRQQALKALSGIAEGIVYDSDGNPVVVDFYPTRCTDADVAHLRYLPTVREVNLSYCYNISDDAVEILTHLPRLEVLYLYRNDPDSHNNFTETLNPATNEITRADLSTQPRITDKSLEYISRIHSLKKLELMDNDFSDAGVLKLRSLTNLRELGLRGPRISPAAISTLRRSLPDASVQ